LVRGHHERAFSLGQYVNDRPCAAGSMLAVAIGTVYKTAMNATSPLQQLADSPIPLRIDVPALPARGGADLVARFFEPLGWHVEAAAVPLDPSSPTGATNPTSSCG
jgi:RNA repair, ligase-Pnkp-associating, region of Hen1